MNSVHSLPVFGREFEPRDTPTESAFNGLLRTFETTDADEARDLESVNSFQLGQISVKHMFVQLLTRAWTMHFITKKVQISN